MPLIARLVVVACDVVAKFAVKLPKVEEALVRMPPVSVARFVTPMVEEKLVAPLKVGVPANVPLSAPPPTALKAPETVDEPVIAKLVVVPLTVRKLVERSLVAKRLVVVALVPVALLKVKFCSVDEPVARMFAAVTRPEKVGVPPKVPVRVPPPF